MRHLGIAIIATTLATGSAFAQAPTPSKFVAQAAASDKFEIDSADVMKGSQNPKIAAFARKMIVDHGKSTSMITAAAQADGLAVKAPTLSLKQRTDVTALKAVPAGKNKDDLYVKQQKASHADALNLMRDYASDGTAPHLKAAAGKIAPVVQTHINLLNAM